MFRQVERVKVWIVQLFLRLQAIARAGRQVAASVLGAATSPVAGEIYIEKVVARTLVP